MCLNTHSPRSIVAWPFRHGTARPGDFWSTPARSLFRQKGAARCSLAYRTLAEGTADHASSRETSEQERLEQSRATTQPPSRVAISLPDVAAARGGIRAVIDLVVDTAVVGAGEMSIVITAMVLIPARQQRHRSPTGGELHDGRRIVSLPTLRCHTCRRRRDEQRRHPDQPLHAAISDVACRHSLPAGAVGRGLSIRWHSS